MSTGRSAAEERVDALWARVRGQVVEVVKKHSPERKDLKFDEIESNSVGIGDLIARMLIQEALKEQEEATAEEIEAARQSLAEEASTIGKTPDALRMTRIPGRQCTVGTIRGPVPHQREYLYFPQLKRGVFPPRPAVKYP